MIHLDCIDKSYPDSEGGRLPVLTGVSLDVAPGEFVAVVGSSGCGKTTLLNIAGGLDTDYEGKVVVDGRDLPRLSDAELAAFRNSTVAFVFQSFNLIAPLTAFENVMLPSYFGAATDAEAPARAAAALARVGLLGKAKRRSTELSGGERQRVAIARALFARPKVLLCDEPTGNLDDRTGAEIVGLFRAVNAEGLTVLVVTHEERVWRAARRVLRLTGGQVVTEAAGGAS